MDSLRLAEAIGRKPERKTSQPMLIEVNVAGEDSKFSVRPEETAALAESISKLTIFR